MSEKTEKPGFEAFAKRRKALASRMGRGVAIIGNAKPKLRNGSDGYYPYRSDSNFEYLSGFPESKALLVVIAGEAPRSVLFCEEAPDFEQLAFDGDTIGTKRAVSEYLFDEAYPYEDHESKIVEILEHSDNVYYFSADDFDWDNKVRSWIRSVRRGAYRLKRTPASKTTNLAEIISEMRLIKDADEIEKLRSAASITANAAKKAMAAAVPGMYEYELEANISFEFRKNGGATLGSFPSIVAGGKNACTLHYMKNKDKLYCGDLVLIDIGAEFEGYAGDVSRTFPVRGRFLPAQAELYSIVLDAQKKAIREVKPGNSFDAPHVAAARAITEGLVRIGLLSGDVETLLAEGLVPRSTVSYKRFFMHRTGHWLGLDTHDVGEYYNPDGTPRTLKKGMALTVEPGPYIPIADDIPEKYRGIGIRIEDDVLVVEGGCEVLTHEAPKEIADIEALTVDKR